MNRIFNNDFAELELVKEWWLMPWTYRGWLLWRVSVVQWTEHWTGFQESLDLIPALCSWPEWLQLIILFPGLFLPHKLHFSALLFKIHSRVSGWQGWVISSQLDKIVGIRRSHKALMICLIIQLPSTYKCTWSGCVYIHYPNNNNNNPFRQL
jgi:hypothetical protein